VSAPLISALFSTFNRAELIRQALDSVVEQTLPKDCFEVVVVDDGSKDDTRAVVQSFSSRLPIRYVFQPNAGLAEGKNHAIMLAHAPLVVFMDDDDVADARLLEEHLRMHEEFPSTNIAVLGYTTLRDDIAVQPLMHFVTNVGFYLFSYVPLTHGCILDYTYFWGGRSSCKRSFLLERGLFNPAFRFGCEDIELGYRLSSAGLRVVYNSKARSTMIRDITFDEFCDRLRRQGHSNFIYSELHKTEEVRRWTDVAGWEHRWADIANRFELTLESARRLDELARRRLAHGLGLDGALVSLLHKSYWRAFDASKLRGVSEAASSRDHVVPNTHHT
jgi:glycosyltransferase involved in cell wall biosynthesis